MNGDTYCILFSKIQHFAEETARQDKSTLREEIHQRVEEVLPTKRRVVYSKMRGKSHAQ